MCAQALFVVSLLALSNAQPAPAPPGLPSLAPSDDATPCGAAFDIARNQTVICLSNASNATYQGAIDHDQYLNMVCNTCSDGFDRILAFENLRKNCTNASAHITAQTHLVKAVLTGVCVAGPSPPRYDKNALEALVASLVALGLMALYVGGFVAHRTGIDDVALSCVCDFCDRVKKCCGGKKKRGRQDADSDDEADEEEDVE